MTEKSIATAGKTTAEIAADLRACIKRANGGDKAALARVRGWMDNPGAVTMFKGDVAGRAMEQMVRAYSGSAVTREAVIAKLDSLRAELLGEGPACVIERLVVERVVASWLHLHVLEDHYAGGLDGMGLEMAAFYEKAIAIAQKRYLRALKGLHDIRRLALPALHTRARG